MLVKIVTTRDEAGTTTIAISGRLAADGLGELEKVCDSVEGEVSLDLTELSWVDAEAKKALQGLLVKGARLRSASPYIRLLLEHEK